MRKLAKHLTLAATVALLGGCGMMGHDHDHMHGGGAMMGGGMMGGDGPAARAEIAPTKGNTAIGMAMFHQQGGSVFMHVKLSNLKPDQEFGFHIHEKGDCSSGDGMSTGGHFNPTGKPHGPQSSEHHAGDLPALKSNAKGQADLHVELKGLSIGSGTADIAGRGLIVHANPDDYTTQPTGNSGPRIACAVIEKVR